MREANAVTRCAKPTLPAPIRTRINKLSHIRGVEHAKAMRIQLTNELEQMAAAGARPEDLCGHLNRLEKD